MTANADEPPKGTRPARLQENDVTHIIQGDDDTVRQRFYDHLGETLGARTVRRSRSTTTYSTPLRNATSPILRTNVTTSKPSAMSRTA